MDETFIEINRVENGACDLIILDYFKQYAPGYRISIESGKGQKNHVTMHYWVHELEQALSLFYALETISVTDVASAEMH